MPGIRPRRDCFMVAEDDESVPLPKFHRKMQKNGAELPFDGGKTVGGEVPVVAQNGRFDLVVIIQSGIGIDVA